MGTHGRGGFERLVLGSAAGMLRRAVPEHHVIRESYCPVLTIRGR